MTIALYGEDAYLREAAAEVVAHTPEGGLVLDRTVFYPTGGGQPGDSGVVIWDGRELEIATTVKGEGDQIVLVPAAPMALPEVGVKLVQHLGWERRHRHMRVHTALHLLSVVLPLPVTGGQVGAEKGRLDFLMPEPPENKDAVEDALNELIDRDLLITESWITEAELDAQPELVKTMSVRPPRGKGSIRLVRIGEGPEQVDLQPCGGTHVARTSEIGAVRLGKVENKGKQNRRVHMHLG
ncbi:alanyl-tRNA editing protein [Lentibacter algarum]|uniref:alanyl-tRNA editing protein n=1 Tax=Lentibacter algarum TaxID=576131 RepID=UPI001C079DBC|nr:alanyl-tRNA editing protein [Lentibacter algarum]MBU2982262.1 alanyl-tRNA editing protein [Lentibacter algarum]